MAKARKVVLDSNRLGKRLRDLAVGGYKLRQEIVVCNTGNYLSKEDLEVCSIDTELGYPVERIEMYFYTMESAKRLVIEAMNGIGKIILEDTEYINEFVESGEKYSLFDGDEVPEFVDGERLVSFRLCLGKPLMASVLGMYELLLDNNFYYDVFNNYEYLAGCSSVENGVMTDLDRKYASEISVLLMNNGFRSVSNYVYESVSGDSRVVLQFRGNSFNLYYTDRFVREELRPLDFGREEFSEELIIGDFARKVLVKPSFNSVMLNGDANNAEFNLSDIDLEVILSELKTYGYRLDSLGIACVSSLEWCRVICGFRGNGSYFYVQFYFDSRDCQYKIRMLSTVDRKGRLDCEGVSVLMVGVDCRDEDTTTLISGFDFGNFKKHSLI